ncbi:MAG: aminotransferase class III-fold pyridoxal phosphate-dependent enzyme [Gammaproteobacteria bacterium]|jgi:acetylornithine/succinyldiaminopimelate/putrescine aminotransferase|nr:aminotransferase class III-fold pyridoxal phosphate-dependent enzyme [Gammaproteobacteria bacterium]MDP6617617.1 aminotransferase class III-fold pyridoxal phosphate-dependent enzyme [Gammaproteobacteria bacterium]MDP6694494.1 aminotransferase class III-fold pyridoxal phosphate-dependent enzyme [Gammaproteobacteria bacterium]
MNAMVSKSYNAREAEQQHLLQVYGQYDFEPVAAEGVHITCRDGRTLLDFYGGHAVASLGYAHPDVLETLNKQAEQLFFQSNAVALEVRATAARKLAAFAPEGLQRIFFVNSGAEANENAFRIALKKTGRNKILAVEHSFHGRTAAAGAVTWGAHDKWYGFPRTPFDVDFIPRDDAQAAHAMVDSDTAAVVIELVQGVAGAYDLAPDFVDAIVSACKQHGALLIVDEVQTGVGRTGYAFAADLYDLQPDILTTAKALGAGFPVGALMLTGDAAGCLGNGDLGTTFGGGPLASALISTVLDVIERDNLLENVQKISSRLQAECLTGPVNKISGKGLLLGLHCEGGAKAARDALLDKDILVGTSGDPDVIRLLPPLILNDEHVDELVAALAAT